jgi:hypothetical protein
VVITNIIITTAFNIEKNKNHKRDLNYEIENHKNFDKMAKEEIKK